MNSDAFVNRELSWLEFNRRVLEEAQDPSVPLLERVKFLAIFSSNLDEFFMVRVAALKRRVQAGDQMRGPDGLTPAETIKAVTTRVRDLVDAQHHCFLGEIQPLLTAAGILLIRPKETSDEQERFLEEYFRRTLLPVLTPLAVDPGHPFPYLGNRSPCLVVSIRPSTPSALPVGTLSVIHIPSQILPRFVALPDPSGKHVFMLLEDVIRQHLPSIYHGDDVLSSHSIRVTRDADLQARGGPEDLLASIEEGVRERRLGTAVRLQYDADLPSDILAMLLDELELSPADLCEGEGFTAFSDLFQLYTALDLPRLKDRPLPPQPV
ncbi:MAG: RNA degradosome polyphosphate kinase, partial [Candidatus Rokuibacteriota bacterium]